MFDVAYAQTGPGAGGLGSLVSFAPLILVFIIFYILLIRPQQKKAKTHQQMLGQLKKNDEVMTSGGIYGKVVALADTVVTLEVAPNVRIRVHRPQISDIIKIEKAVTKE
jgi:preprotein translocase subunit YajC